MSYNGRPLFTNSTILLGPEQINGTGFLSITSGVVNSNDTSQFLGFLTIIMSTRGIDNVLNSEVGLEDSGVTLLAGSDSPDNRFPSGYLYNQPPQVGRQTLERTDARFLFPLQERYEQKRHRQAEVEGQSFKMKAYSAIISAFSRDHGSPNNAHSSISARNENNAKVSVGYALPPTPLCDWVVLVELSQAEVYQPLVGLRKILLGTIFGVVSAALTAVPDCR